MTFSDFVKQCRACGDDWTDMFMSGIQVVAPEVYEQMPDRSYSFQEVSFIVNHLCTDTQHLPICVSAETGETIEYYKGFKFRKATEEDWKRWKTQLKNIYGEDIDEDN